MNLTRICGKDFVKGLLGWQRSRKQKSQVEQRQGGVKSQNKEAQVAAVGPEGMRERTQTVVNSPETHQR